MDVKVAGCLFFAILAGIEYTVDADAVSCALLAADCAVNLTNVISDNVDKGLIAPEYTCKAVDGYKACMKGDGTCPGYEAEFNKMLKTMNIDLETLCANTGGKPGGNNGGNGGKEKLASVFSISLMYTLAMLAICII